MELKRVVITGLGAITPIGKNVQEYWDSLCKGVSGAGMITRFDASKFKSRIACEIKDFDPLQYFDRKEARKLDFVEQYAIISADEAIQDSGINRDNTDFTEVGVIFASGNISIKYGFQGPNYCTVSACASSANAIINAFRYIHYGRNEVMIAGGAEAPICPISVGGFEAMKALSTRNDDPTTASRPFDADRDGFVMGEGGGCLVLEELGHAIKRGAKIYGEIVGCGESADAHHITSPHPDGQGAALSMTRALKEAGIKPDVIDHINTHGTSTPAGDIPEILGIKSVFGEHVYDMSINSGKSMTGHLLGGAGAVEAISTVLACKNGIVPPTINHFTDDPNIDPKIDFTFWKPKQRTVNYAISNAFGFGGHNASIIFKKF